MDAATFDINLIANIVKKMLHYFEEWNLKTSVGKGKYNHVDVTLSKDGTMQYTIQVTNYGQSTDDILSFSKKVFCDFLTAFSFLTNSPTVTVYGKTERKDSHDILDITFKKEHLSLTERAGDKNLIDIYHQKKYLSFLLKNQLASSYLKEFTNTILSEIFLLQRLNSYTKFTVSINQRVIYNNYIPLDNDYKSCRVLTDSLTSVIKQSLDVKFKENCFSMLNVENSHEVETALMCKLLPLIHENYTLSKTN